ILLPAGLDGYRDGSFGYEDWIIVCADVSGFILDIAVGIGSGSILNGNEPHSRRSGAVFAHRGAPHFQVPNRIGGARGRSSRRHDREWFVCFCFGDEQITASRNGYHDDSKNDPQTLRSARRLGTPSRLGHAAPPL